MIILSNSPVLAAHEAYVSLKYLVSQLDHNSYAIFFGTLDSKYCVVAVLLTFFPGQDDDILKIKKGQKVDITGVVYDIGDRTFNTNNNGNMAAKVVKMKGGIIR
mgnify:CR=1 FL=1